ncbi:MAG: MFS transporter [Oscillospiraceae bacterium]|nr:MFS transporter [Oscillospiraceae bacterium]
MASNARRARLMVAVAGFAVFLATFNETFLNVAFTPIMADFGIGVSTVQWLAAAYMLGAAVMVPVTAFLYRSIPTRRFFLGTVCLMVAGSVVGALSVSFPMLLIGRIIQALGAGMIIPICMSIVLEVAPREKMGAYLGIMGALTALGPSLSIIVSGILLSFCPWHVLEWVFFGLTVICFILGAALLDNIALLTHPKLDKLSILLVAVGLVGVLYAISTAFSGTAAAAAGAAVIGVIFLILFVRRQNRLPEPLLDLRPLSVKPFTAAVLINVAALVIVFAMNILMPIFVQSALGASAFSASVTLFPAILVSCLLAPVAGKIYDRQGAKLLLPLGCLLMFLFLIAIAFAQGLNSFPLLAVLYVPIMCGMAFITGPVQTFGLSQLPPELNPHGVTVFSTGFQVAGCIGSSLFTGIYAARVAGRLAAGAAERAALGSGFTTALLLAAIFALLGILLSLYARRYSLRQLTPDRAAAPLPTSPLRTIMKEDVYTVRSDATLLEAMRMIVDKKISGAPVVDAAGALVGFISDGDVMRYLARVHPKFTTVHSLSLLYSPEHGFDQNLSRIMHLNVMDLAAKTVYTVNLDDGLDEVCRVLMEHSLKKAPVMDGETMVGIINRSNITKYAINTCLAAMEA